MHMERIILLHATARIDVHLRFERGRSVTPTGSSAPPNRVQSPYRRCQITPPAVAEVAGPPYSQHAGLPDAPPIPAGFTCSEPRLPTKNTPQFSISSPRNTSPLVNVIMSYRTSRRSRKYPALVRNRHPAP